MTYPVCVCVCCEYLFLTGFACYTLSLFVSPSRSYFSLWLHVSRIVTDYRCLNARVGKSLIDFLPIWMQHFAPPLPPSPSLSVARFVLYFIPKTFSFNINFIFIIILCVWVHSLLPWLLFVVTAYIHWVSFHLTRNRSDICIWHLIWYTFI